MESSSLPVPINIPARAGSPLLSRGWTVGDHDRDGESCVLSQGPSVAIYLPFWPGREGEVKVRLNIQVFHQSQNEKGEDRPRVTIKFNGQRLLTRPMDHGWFPLNLTIPASSFHHGENEIEIIARTLHQGKLVSAESARLAFSGLELTLPRIEAGLLLGRVQQKALVTAGPLAIDLPEALPAGAELCYSVALMPWFAPATDGAVISRVTATALSEETENDATPVCANEHRLGTDLLTTTAKAAGCRWRHHRLPLAALAGKKVRLELTADTAAGSASSPPLHAWGSLVLTWPGDDEPDVRPYNVIIILADTLRADRLGSGGSHRRLTPHLDRLSRRAVTFQDTAAQAPATYPSLSSMFSGDYYTRISRWTQEGGLPPLTPIMGEIFSASGFQTVGIVTNPLVRPEAGFSRGFHCYDNSMIFKEATAINERFRQWFPTLTKTRFFAYLHYMDIHAPYGSPEFPKPRVFHSGRLKGHPWEGGLPPVAREFIEHGSCSLDQNDRMIMVEQYNEGIRFWDRQLGRLLAALDHQGLLSNSIVVVIADHGEEFFEHGLAGHGQSLYQELVHVPALILFPPGSGIRQPQQITKPIELLDILPTLCDFLEIPLPDGYQGQSRLPLLLDAGETDQLRLAEADQPRLCETRHRNWIKPPFNEFLSGIHHGKWKLIHNRLTGEDELYDLLEDPGEAADLAKDRADKVEELQGIVDTIFNQTETGPASDARDRREREALEALGYVQ